MPVIGIRNERDAMHKTRPAYQNDRWRRRM